MLRIYNSARRHKPSQTFQGWTQLRRRLTAKKSQVVSLIGSFLLLGATSQTATADTTIVREIFSGSTAYGWTVEGTGVRCLTAAGPSAPGSIPNCPTTRERPGTGVLRLTDATQNKQAFVYYNYAIPSSRGLVITFDYYAYGGTGADGTTFFLFDGGTVDPRPGSYGGALGYAQNTDPGVNEPGLTNAYLGVGIDEFGNFANDYEGRGAGGVGNPCTSGIPAPRGGPGLSPPVAQVPDSVTMRAMGMRQTGYCYLDNTGTLSFSLDNRLATSRTAPDTKRKIRVTLRTNRTLTLEIDPTGTGQNFQTVLRNVPAPQPISESFRFGFASSTGALTNIHEIQNFEVATILTPPLPDLKVTKSHSGNFTPGDRGTYTLNVQNLPTATGSTYGPVFIKDTLPPGFSYVSSTGRNWNCSATGQDVNCVYTGVAVAPGGSLPALSITTNVTATPGNYTNTAVVSTAGDSDLANNTATDATLVGVSAPNLRLVKRITAVIRGGVPLTEVDLTRFVDDPNDTNDNAPGWSQLPLVGVAKLPENIRLESGDEVEYSVYFLSDGTEAIASPRFCDPIPDGTTFLRDNFGSNQGILMNNVGAIAAKTNTFDSDEGQFFSPLAPLPAGIACDATNPNGTVTLNLSSLSNLAGSNFGFIRFRVKID